MPVEVKGGRTLVPVDLCMRVPPNEQTQAYNEEWPLPPGWERRQVVYNLYHILNHIVLFGGGYRSQAQRMIDQIMKM